MGQSIQEWTEWNLRVANLHQSQLPKLKLEPSWISEKARATRKLENTIKAFVFVSCVPILA